jgi:hypothetical protein
MNQAERVIAKFGNARDVARALAMLNDPMQHRTPASIYKWTWPKPKGTGGRIPGTAIEGIIAAGRLVGVLITSEDLYVENPAPTYNDFVRGAKHDAH